MREELSKLLDDIKKVQQAEELLSSIKTTSFDCEIDKLFDYALNHRIIRNSTDVVDMCIAEPTLKTIITEHYDQHMYAKLKEANDRYERRFAGTYDSLKDVPGYGTEWNERCIPDGVVIRGRNSRC